jgi:hypothetical protein
MMDMWHVAHTGCKKTRRNIWLENRNRRHRREDNIKNDFKEERCLFVRWTEPDEYDVMAEISYVIHPGDP